MNRVSAGDGKVQIHPGTRFSSVASCSGIRVSAQVSTATVAGVVQDSSKASIPGASVKAHQHANGCRERRHDQP